MVVALSPALGMPSGDEYTGGRPAGTAPGSVKDRKGAVVCDFVKSNL